MGTNPPCWVPMSYELRIIRKNTILRSRDMKKQTIALLASGLLLASGMSFAQDTAPGTGGNTAAGATGGLSVPAGVGVVVAVGGLAYGAASDGSGSGSSTTTSTATQTGN